MSQPASEVSVIVQSASESQVASEKRGSYIPGERSGKWSSQEHMRYIAFIDFNKDRTRSREKRRSNKFYQEMADFIVTRNALQCRSHHQKLEEKYTQTIKIVNLFKPSFERTAYKQAIEQLQIARRDTPTAQPIKQTTTEIAKITVQTQTDICGLNLEFVNVGNNCYLIQPPAYRYFPPQPSFYYNNFFLAPPPQPTTHTLPADGLISPGTWEGSMPSEFGGSSL